MGKHARVKHGENLTRGDKGACIPRNEDTPRIRLVIARFLVVLDAAGAGHQAAKGRRPALGDQR